MYERISRSERIRLELKKLQEDATVSEVSLILYSREIRWIEKNYTDLTVTITGNYTDKGLKSCKIKKVQ